MSKNSFASTHSFRVVRRRSREPTKSLYSFASSYVFHLGEYCNIDMSAVLLVGESRTHDSAELVIWSKTVKSS